MSSALRYSGFSPRSRETSAAARGSSRKEDTKPELLLRRALWKKGCRYQKHRGDLPGSPDVVFPRARVIVFVDGDFWHGKDWETRKQKLRRGHNSEYWIRKIEANLARDLRQASALQAAGWTVLRVWESDIASNVDAIVERVQSALGKSFIAPTRNGELTFETSTPTRSR